ncbi:DUF2147 domain-containing protein [Sphingobium sp.]|uniref:DUF2147 domain-containing protein n=1 Tax=Sphingobium sp. TaxID=1912891 RepID=UPI0028BED8C7|nr:DUF2147 domain-containing protein [Sphingobium sp.]
MGYFSMLLLLAAGTSPPGVEGNWLTDDGKGVVQIAPCGAHMCGRIARVLDKGPGVPASDINNPDPKLRGQPILGLVTLSGFSRDGAVWKDGRAYDPKSGRSYRASLRLNPDGSLKVTGCVLFICQSRRWTRMR